VVPYAEVIGDPIDHSLSPKLQRFFLDRMGWEGEYRALRVSPDELPAYFEARRRDDNWRGCNITMPHKLAALAHAPHRTDPSFPVEPISLALRQGDGTLEGHPLDATAIVQSLLGSSLRFGGESGPAIVIGAGGAAQAAMWALAHFGCAPIWVVNRSREKAEAVASERRGIGVQVLSDGSPTPAASILVNATPQGMAGRGEVEIDLSPLPDHAIVYDMVYAPLETGLLRRARQRGLATRDGLDMLIPQVAISCAMLFGRKPGELIGEVPRALWAEAKAAVIA
jgi:shikimate dehydrogenase